MAEGALTQLVAIGAQESQFITKDTKSSIFYPGISKTTNFVKADKSIYSEGTGNWGTTVKFRINKNGDLLGSCYVVVELPELSLDEHINLADYNKLRVKWVDYIGNVLVENVKLYIGGQLIDEQSGEFNQIYTDLTDDDWNKLCLIGLDDNLIKPRQKILSTHIYVPLKFWFCNDMKKALPLIALQYHDVEIEVKIREWQYCYQILKNIGADGVPAVPVQYQIYNDTLSLKQVNIKDIRLDCNYYYLDSEDRKRIAQSEHKFLITQVQKRSCSLSQGLNIDLNFNHPVKEMFFYIQNDYIRNLPEPFNFSATPTYITKEIKEDINTTYSTFNNLSKNHNLGNARILINGFSRVDWRDYKYYYYLQNYENYRNKLEHYIYLYAFSPDPKSSTAYGCMNFSRIDNAQLQFNINKQLKEIYSSNIFPKISQTLGVNGNFTINVYAINYNFLIVKGGMAGVEYSV